MIAPDITQIQAVRPQRRTTSLIYVLPISVSGLMVSSRQILDPVVQEFYSTVLCDICKDSTSLPFPDSPIPSSFTAEITVLRRALGWCLRHHSICPVMSPAVLTNSQSSLTLLNSASNLLASNAVRTIWSSITAYLIWLNCPFIGSVATMICVPMRSLTC